MAAAASGTRPAAAAAAAAGEGDDGAVGPWRPFWDIAAERGDVFYEQRFGAMREAQLPILYAPQWNISFCGIEKLHPFDSEKYGHVAQYLCDVASIMTPEQFVEPDPPSMEHLLMIHSEEYLQGLNSSVTVAYLVELPPVAMLPNFIVRRHLVNPMLLHVGGTILGGQLALKHGWAIALGGGMHHASRDQGGGWCIFADIMLSLTTLRMNYPDRVQRALLIDLDVHQGNGCERDKLYAEDNELFVLDAFRAGIYPHDQMAMAAIDVAVRWRGDETDDEFVERTAAAIDEIFTKMGDRLPDVVYYNAGTDILETDPLGGMYITPEGVVRRDELVWDACLSRGIPIVMVLSGGYTKPLSANTIGMSIENLEHRFRILSNLLAGTGGGKGGGDDERNDEQDEDAASTAAAKKSKRKKRQEDNSADHGKQGAGGR